MKIGIYSPRSGIARAGGTETFLREMMNRLQDDHEIILYCGLGEVTNEIHDLSVEVRQIPFIQKGSRLSSHVTRWTPVLPAELESFSMYLNGRRQGVFEEIDNEVDVLSTHYYLDNLLVSRAVSVPTLFRFPGIKHPSPRWKAMIKFARPSTMLANSEATAARLREWIDLDVDGIVYAGVDLDQFAQDANHAFKSDRISILFVGRIDEGKGLHELVEAQSRLDDLTRLYLVGRGTLESDLQARVHGLGIEDSVEFVGPIPHNEVHRYFAAADIFCLPSHHEGFPVVNMEAMACGCAVVSTRIDSIEEQLTDGENALLVEPGDVDALTEALRQLAKRKDLRERLANTGLETATRFSWKMQANIFEKYYEQTRNISHHSDV
jgi:glycosyltransferase involved in cell wall biosynthesis